jgi:hypothetical protein
LQFFGVKDRISMYFQRRRLIFCNFWILALRPSLFSEFSTFRHSSRPIQYASPAEEGQSRSLWAEGRWARTQCGPTIIRPWVRSLHKITIFKSDLDMNTSATASVLLSAGVELVHGDVLTSSSESQQWRVYGKRFATERSRLFGGTHKQWQFTKGAVQACVINSRLRGNLRKQTMTYRDLRQYLTFTSTIRDTALRPSGARFSVAVYKSIFGPRLETEVARNTTWAFESMLSHSFLSEY